MDRMTSLRVFREVVEAGSFAAAAGRLAMSPPMASKHVAQLEKSLGARLLHRSSRHLSLTEAGTAWYEQSRRALDLLDAAEAAIGQTSEAPRGQLKVSAPVWCATPRFARVLADYRGRFPEVLVDMHLENRKVDLAADGYDLALRATQEPSPALIARPLCRVPFHLAGTPAYLARMGGCPALPAELSRLGAIVPSYVNLDNLALKGPGGRMLPLRLAPAMRSDDTTLTLHAVHAGIGIAFLPLWLIDDDLAKGRLVRLLPDYEAEPVTLFAVYTSRQYMAPKLRTFIDFLGERLGALEPKTTGCGNRSRKAPKSAPFQGKVMRAGLQSGALWETLSLFRFFEKLLHPYPATEPPVPPQGFFAFLWTCMHGVRGKIAVMAVLTAAMSIFEAALFAILGRVVDWLSGQEPSRLWADRGDALLWMAAVLVGSIVVVALQTIVKHQTLAVNLPMRLRWNFHRLMLGQSMAFYQDEFAGRITAKVMQTALAVRDTIFVLADVLVAMGVYVATMIILVGVLDAQLVWPFLIWLALYIGSLAYFVPRLGKVGKAQADARALMTGRVTDAYTNIATVKLFSHTQREAGFARDAMREFMHTGYGQMRLVSAFEIVNHTLSMGLTAGMAGTALWLWSHGAVGVGAVAAATAMALRLQGMSHWIMWEMTSLFENIGTVQDGMKTLSRPRTVLDAPDATALEVPRGEVRFENASFRYADAGRRVIDTLNLTVRPGEKIGLVGRSGAGKSTLVNLLLRFHDLESGRILVDGQDIAHVTQDSLRSHIGMVTQDTSLMHRSVADNIAYGRPDATLAQIEAAARRAEAHDFIQTLGDASGRRGYEAHVGERGVKLSGGQRQRVAIARVMLKDAPILLLDEATSALDSEVEAAIQQSLYTLMEGKTVIAIAHRLSTIAAMDRLIVLDEGRVVEEGDHRTLMAKGGLYARLWAHQSGGFLGDSLDEESEAAAA